MLKTFFNKFKKKEVVSVRPIILQSVTTPYNELEGKQRDGFCDGMLNLKDDSNFNLLVTSLKLKYADQQLNGTGDVLPNTPISTTWAEFARVAVNVLDELESEVVAFANEGEQKRQDEYEKKINSTDDSYI